MKREEIVSIARNKASQSICRCKVSAIGFNSKGEIVAKSTNRPGYCSAKGRGLHAEAQLFKIARKKGIKTIFICRTSKNGNLLPIHPCSSCKAQADKLDIKIVW